MPGNPRADDGQKSPRKTRRFVGGRMNFRRSEFDVTNRINTTDPVCVKLEVGRIFRTLYSRNQAPILNRAFDDLVRMYRGQLPGYASCDTEYHDIQHVMDVTLA